MAQVAFASSYEDQRSRSSHFRDGKFHNPAKSAKSFWVFLKMRLKTTYATWPDKVESTYGRINSSRVDSQQIHVTHINHATVLIQTQGLNILTDPIYSERCSPLSWIGPKRHRDPGIKFEDLPPIDVILISHDHYDHLDLPTIEKLVKRDKPQIFLGLGVGERLPSMENVTEMDWWESAITKNHVRIHFVPVQHFSGRTLTDRNSTLWGGYVVETKTKKIYFGGDTGYADHFKQTKEKFGPIDLALIPIGAYEPRDFMKYAHINPHEAVQAHLDLGSKLSIGVHYGTFQLTAEPIDEPVRALDEALKEKGIAASSFQTPDFGKTIIIE